MPRVARRPLVAVALSLVAPGVGHLYLGRLVPGLSLTFGSLALGILGTLAAVAFESSLGFTAFIAVAYLGLWIAAAISAFLTARRIEGDYELREYNRWYVYALLSLVAIPSAGLWAVSVRKNVVQVFRVPSASMEPSVPRGSMLIVNEVAYRRGPVKRGDRVVFTNPNERYQTFIKRVVALPKDVVEMRAGELFVNGQKLEHTTEGSVTWERNGDARYPITLSDAPETPKADTFPPVEVPSGHCFVLGDRRNRSIDSRSFSALPLADIVGRVDYVF